MRSAMVMRDRSIVTSETSKHRYFVWCPAIIAPEYKLVVIPRSDAQTFGILSSRIHVLWAERAGSRLGVGNDPVYTTSRCVEPFPFPQDLTLDLPPSEQPIAEAIAIAAKRLNDLRESWLNPPEWTQRVPEVIPLGMDASPYPDRIVPKNGHEKELAERTLTKLYNQRPAWLDAAHKTLDAAVATAYGWADYSADMPDEEILKRLLALNLERAVKVAV